MYLTTVSGFTFVQLLSSSRVLRFKIPRTVKYFLTTSRFQSVSKTLENNVLYEKSLFERHYFKNIMDQNSKYQACINANSSFINENSTNAFVIKLRSLSDSKENESDIPPLEHFKNEIFTIDDLIETFYLLSLKAVITKIPFDMKDLRNFLEEKNKIICQESRTLNKCLTLLHFMRKVDVRICKPCVSYYIVQYVQRKFKGLTSSQIVEYFYFLHFYKGNYVRKETKFGLELIIVNLMHEFTMDEIAVIAYGLFRSQNHPGTHLSKAISDRIEEGILTCNEVQMSVFSKFLKYSGRRVIAQNVKKILDKCLSIIDEFTLTTGIHIGCSGITVNVENPKLINRLIQRAKENMSTIRIKDIERLLLTCLYANIQLTKESDFIRAIEEELKIRNEEIKKYPISYLNILQFLIMCEIYLDEHINFALSENFHQYLPKMSMRNKLHELLFIDISMEIERPDYRGNKLTLTQRKKIVTRDFYRTNSKNSSWKCNYEVFDILKNTYGEKSCALIHLLPNYDTLHPVICLNENNEAVNIEGKLEDSWEVITVAPKDGNKWFCFVRLRLQGCLSDGITPNLVTEAKLRQFRAAGYIPILIHGHLYSKKSMSEKHSFVIENLEKVLGNVKN